MIWNFSNDIFGAATAAGNLFMYEISAVGAAPIPNVLGDGAVQAGGIKLLFVQVNPTNTGGIF